MSTISRSAAGWLSCSCVDCGMGSDSAQILIRKDYTVRKLCILTQNLPL